MWRHLPSTLVHSSVFLTLSLAARSRGYPSGPQALSPVSRPLPSLPSSGSPQPLHNHSTPSPGLGRLGRHQGTAASPDSPGSSPVGRHQPPVPGRGERLGGLTGVSASNSGAPEPLQAQRGSPSLLGPPPPAPRAGGSQQQCSGRASGSTRGTGVPSDLPVDAVTRSFSSHLTPQSAVGALRAAGRTPVGWLRAHHQGVAAGLQPELRAAEHRCA